MVNPKDKIFTDSSSDSSSSTNRVLYDNPKEKLTSLTEAYRQAHLNEISAPTEFSTYIRHLDLKIEGQKTPNMSLPLIKEAMEGLAAMEIPWKTRTPSPPIKGNIRKCCQKWLSHSSDSSGTMSLKTYSKEPRRSYLH